MKDLTKIATTTLSEITHYTTVAVGPRSNMQIIEEIKFVLLGSRMLMCVIVTDSGLVKETIIKFDEDITSSQVETINNLFNNKLKGNPLDKIDKPMEEYIMSELNYSVNVIKPIIEQINKIVEDEEKIYLEGIQKSLWLTRISKFKNSKKLCQSTRYKRSNVRFTK